ncbi:hypothetical protein [Oceanicaulis sp. MMSF_3324]|uniref:hypothetical protein n=1 Tax=Oceanicaulis sp. MMSF_3324 TaxID=3046702 RepID=UPI00273FA184|nr:hypothetical protein [Oceanicaulis sp. MMSF_3324]
MSAYHFENLWPDTQNARGVLFFAQLWSELLNAQTFESFRAYTLDTRERVNELCEIWEDIDKGRVPDKTADFCLQELQWSISKDPVLNTYAPNLVDLVTRHLKKQNFDKNDALAIQRELTKYLDENYVSLLTDLICNNLSNPTKKNTIRKSAGFLLSHIINKGYSKSYIYERLKSRFFTTNHYRVGSQTVRSFLREFESDSVAHSVYIPVDDTIASILSRLGYRSLLLSKSKEHLKTANRNTLSENGKWSHAILFTCDARDPHTAAQLASEKISSVRAIALLEPKPFTFNWSHQCAVRRKSAQSETIVSFSSIDWLLEDNNPSRNIRNKSIQKYARRLLSAFEPDSYERVVGAINMVALARDTPALENRLVALWSGIEVLLSEPKSSPRISHFVDELAPCIASRHLHRKIKYLHDNLFVLYRSRYTKLLKSINSSETALNIFIIILTLKKHGLERQILCNICSDNPLMLHRLYCVQKDVSSPKALLKATEEHYDRVKWQIRRIYRSRNSLVHSGKVPKYLDLLTINAGEYFRSALSTLSKEAEEKDNSLYLDVTLRQASMRYSSKLRLLDKNSNSEWNPELLKDILF